jgi:hypothetical protein
MTDPDRLKTLWQTQATETRAMSVEALQTRALTFRKKVRWRNLRELIASVFVVAAFVAIGLKASNGWGQAGAALIILATVWVLWRLLRDGQAAAPPPAASAATLLAFHRGQLVKLRHSLNTMGRWYLAPFVPGVVLLMVSRWVGPPALGRTVRSDHEVIILCSVIVALILLVVWLANKLGAMHLQRQIDELDALGRE